MDDIAAMHAALISSLNKLYDTLLAMRYLSPEEVLRPPHSSEAISDDTFQALGYESETIQLMRLIPHLRGNVAWGFQNEGTEILPRSQAVSYAIERDTDWIDYLRWGDKSMSSHHRLLHPWMLRLSIGRMYPGQYGVDLIYDTRTRL
ncbi:hypothetical protein E8E13_003654 [Curvularia kusanoi]|uniref:Uncharacterized protein n=1 Tax=Curvularia kusanoi TaxID=90978 RepID=A0A9P4TFA0_CURKU|nr:hypothetical protein E8E13_003654 [Curvularia kusanoi]